MIRHLVLLNFTEKGAANIKQSPARAADLRKVAESAGVKIGDIYWTLGQYDGVFVAEADDEATLVGFMLHLNQLGNVRTSCLRAYDAAEFQDLVAKAP